MLIGRSREFCRSFPNQQEITVRGIHFIQEDSPDEIGLALARFIGANRSAAAKDN
jgi:haloalkane dehalogenase